MIQIDKTDFLYKTLNKLGVQTEDIDDEYLRFANEGVATINDFNNYLLSQIELVGNEELSDDWLEGVADYYYDIKAIKKIPKSKFLSALKEYKQTKDVKLRDSIINSQLKEALLIACAYKYRHNELILDDLVQISNMGLINAVEKYQVDSRIAFDTYLHYWILDAINKEFTQGEKNG